MATARIVPNTVAQDIQTLATNLDAELNITAAEVIPDDSLSGDLLLTHVFVTGTASVDITNAVTAVGNCEIVGDTLTA